MLSTYGITSPAMKSTTTAKSKVDTTTVTSPTLPLTTKTSATVTMSPGLKTRAVDSTAETISLTSSTLPPTTKISRTAIKSPNLRTKTAESNGKKDVRFERLSVSHISFSNPYKRGSSIQNFVSWIFVLVTQLVM
ncbi:uncharacterized protein [Apostichopus japonicus]|uniref:uncharacterized protein n=1 Tax=Stichopus japonicus TaxID=307972 RepID=UPI003AB84900